MRPIDADALLEKMQRTSRYFSVVYDVDAMPTLDVMPVVRCKDCRYAGVHVVVDTHEIIGHWCGLLDIDDVSDDDFAALASARRMKTMPDCAKEISERMETHD